MLKLQYFGHLMQRADSLEKTLMLGKIDCRRRSRWQRMRCWMASLTQWTWVCTSSGSWWWTENPGMLQSMGSQRVRHDWVTELNWTPGINCDVRYDSNLIFLNYISFLMPCTKKKFIVFALTYSAALSYRKFIYVFIHMSIYIPELAIVFWGLSICDEFHIGFIIIVSLSWLFTMLCI